MRWKIRKQSRESASVNPETDSWLIAQDERLLAHEVPAAEADLIQGITESHESESMSLSEVLMYLDDARAAAERLTMSVLTADEAERKRKALFF